MEKISSANLQKYQEETRTLLHQRINTTVLFGAFLFPCFSILDYVVAPSLFTSFFILRILCSLSLLGIYIANRTSFSRRQPFSTAITAYAISALTISIMIIKLGGITSSYYIGMVMVLVVCAVILPLNPYQAAGTGILVYSFYLAPIFIYNQLTPSNLKILFNNTFFFVSFLLIIIVKCLEESRARKREFNMRMKEDALAAQLSYHADHLEEEVANRTKELKKSEIRYQKLYENISDDVILTDRDGKIVMANPRFYETMGDPAHEKAGDLILEFVHPDDQETVLRSLLQQLQDGRNVTGLQFRFINKQKQIIDVECNATTIYKDQALVGYQMLVRDITDRKKLETELLASFTRVQETRSATILSLANLAEYRDINSGNHLERIREFCRILATELALKPKYHDYISTRFIEDIYMSSILHDIGKVGIPDNLLLKADRLTPDEIEIIQQHTLLGGDTIKAIEGQVPGPSFLTMGKTIAYFHHEKWDGSGYPQGLNGEEIPLSSRIVSLADVYDALTSKRTYKESFSHQKALAVIVEEKGRHFDPDVVEAFLAREKEFQKIKKTYEDKKPLALSSPNFMDWKKLKDRHLFTDYPNLRSTASQHSLKKTPITDTAKTQRKKLFRFVK